MCTSGSVETVADKTVAAKQQVVKLQKMLKEEEDSKKRFYDEIDRT